MGTSLNKVRKVLRKRRLQCPPLVSQKEAYLIDAVPVKAIDTTAAGDSFIASIALKLSMGETLIEAIKFATKVASIVVTQKGAQAAIPELEDIR